SSAPITSAKDAWCGEACEESGLMSFIVRVFFAIKLCQVAAARLPWRPKAPRNNVGLVTKRNSKTPYISMQAKISKVLTPVSGGGASGSVLHFFRGCLGEKS